MSIRAAGKESGERAPVVVEIVRNNKLEVDFAFSEILRDVLHADVRVRDDPDWRAARLPELQSSSDRARLACPGRACMDA